MVDRAEGGAASRPAPSDAAHGRPLVLVVEDDPDCRTIYRIILEEAGFGVIETTNGAEGLRLAVQRSPDIILMDLRLPGIDGWAATRLLTSRPETMGIPVVALTCNVLPQHREEARQAGCVAFLAKPIEPAVIVAEIRGIISRSFRRERASSDRFYLRDLRR